MLVYIPDSPQSINEEPAYEIAPSVWAGGYSCLNNHFLHTRNIKIIINTSPTFEFVRELEHSDIQVSLDMVILMLDPLFLYEGMTNDESSFLLKAIKKYNRVLQNYITHFFLLAQRPTAIVHKMAGQKDLEIPSPILTGNLKNLLFAINRLIKLLRNINSSVEVLILSKEDDGNPLQVALAILYLMDSYGFQLESSFNHLKLRNPRITPFNSSYYEDLLIIENLKKFYKENNEIKCNSLVLTTNQKLKRRNSDDDEWMETGGKRIR